MDRLPNIDYVVGDSVPIRVELIDELLGEYLDITGATAGWWTLKQNPGDADSAAIIAKTMAGAGIDIVGAGQVDLKPLSSETANLLPGYQYFGDLRLKLITGRLLTVTFTLTAQPCATQSAA